MKLTRRKRKTILYTICAVVFVVLCIVLGMQIVQLKHKNEELEKRKIKIYIPYKKKAKDKIEQIIEVGEGVMDYKTIYSQSIKSTGDNLDL